MPEQPGMFDPFAATTTSAARVGSSRDALRRMQAEDSDRRMLAFLDELDEWSEESRSHDREAGLDPGVAVLLDAIAGADDAPFELQSLHRRVSSGALTWEQVWDAPEREPGGSRLVNLAMKAAGAELSASLRSYEDEAAERGAGGTLGRDR